MSLNTTAVRIKVTLKDVKPEVMRRLVVPVTLRHASRADAAKILFSTQVLSAAGLEAHAYASNPCRPEAPTAARRSSASRRQQPAAT